MRVRQSKPPKKLPLRMCKGCGEMKLKKELIRVVRAPDGAISLDPAGKKPGRGVYVCPNGECLKKARKARRFEREFSCKIPDDVYEVMEHELIAAAGNAEDSKPAEHLPQGG